jgi:3-hydroxymyristoyl/3-hydroxydecanoyl-(acyl carrier protein) dehydratase
MSAGAVLAAPARFTNNPPTPFRGTAAAAFVTQSLHLTITVSADHPSLPGHFPGRPVVPGAVILSEIVHAATAAFGGARVAGLPSVKFTSPMLPAQVCDLVLTDKGGGSAAFELAHAGRRIASGQLRYQRPGPES